MLIAIIFAMALFCTIVNIQQFIASLILFIGSTDKLNHKDKYRKARTPYLVLACICWAIFYYLTNKP